MKEKLIEILKEIGLKIHNESGNGESFEIEVKNSKNEQIGKFYFTKKDGNESLFFYVFDPSYGGYTIEGGGCHPNKESMKSIIDEFTYFKY